MNNFVFPEELSFFVESIRPFEIRDVGSDKWLDVHEMTIKLSQQAILEAAEHREEEVKEMLISCDKLKILIHEAYCVYLWKTKVLPHLLDIDPNPQATFLIYTVLYHEGAVITLLDVALYHSSGCEALQDTSLDLIDYCAQGVAQVIGLVSMGYHENEDNIDVDEAILTELERQKRDLIYKIGIRCISILSYLADNLNSLPISAMRRMIVTHDIIWLMADLLQFRPWQRKTKKGLEKYLDEKWTVVHGENVAKVVKHEAQAWFCLRQLLFNPNVMQSYELNDERRKHLGKCLGLLHESLLDQLPPLIDLKQYLCQLSMSGNTSPPSKKSNLVLEELPEIKENLIAETEKYGGFLGIAQMQEKIFLCNDKDHILNVAQRLNIAYNTDLMAELEEKVAATKEMKKEASNVESNKNGQQTCGNCHGNAEKKCSQCKSVYYCSRKCQLDDWPKHKTKCIKIE
ncbi:zinc finger MYND domain-containing protein 10 homolog [Musca vetustissima]|uniref:zinc finger MYND domain-containing protein 10 homolog n=1 Tax=Musca vetustissima TaxID=27455 RepID=UPI002AB64403|nr:zinc finger MYND domain-containing protein 10 homolog [Musca vetustissima]